MLGAQASECQLILQPAPPPLNLYQSWWYNKLIIAGLIVAESKHNNFQATWERIMGVAVERPAALLECRE